MSERSQVGEGNDRASVLIVVREFAELMLASVDPEQNDEDVTDLVVAGLRALVPGAEVLRARFAMSDDGDLQLQHTDDVARLRTFGETEASLFDAVSAAGPVSRHGQDGEQTSLVAPLVLRAGAIDLLVLRRTAPGGLSHIDALAFSVVCDLANAAITRRQARDEARLDALTGCLNHGAMHAQLAKELARVERAGGELTCVMLDLDEFKSVNERHGHPVGDELLQAVAAELSAQCRPYDSCCRYGGDEFLLILPNTDMPEAMLAAERMRAAVARAAVTHGGDDIAVSATTGVAAWHANESAADLIMRADQALLKGKVSRTDDPDR